MKSLFLSVRIIVMAILMVAVCAAFGQQPPPAQPQGQTVTPKAPYDSKDAKIAVLSEENLQLKANATQTTFQTQMTQLQADWKKQEDTLIAWTDEVRKANGWDDTYSYDRANDKWVHTPKTPEKKAEPAKPSARLNPEVPAKK